MKFRIQFIVVLLIGTMTTLNATNYALQFDGTNDYVRTTTTCPALNMNGSSFTIECWVKSTFNHEAEVILVEYGDSWETGTYQISSFNQNHMMFVFNGASTQYAASVGTLTDWTDGNWHHIAGVLDHSNSTIKLYYDGTLVADTTEALTPGNADLPLNIGSRGGTGLYFNGYMDEVRIWNVARSAEEIMNGAYTELSGAEPGLVAYYKMNTGSGTSLLDSSATKRYPATLYNGTAWSSNTTMSGREYYPPEGDGYWGEIANLQDLFWLTQHMDYWNKTYLLTADIDASASSDWDNGAGFTPIGIYDYDMDDDAPFSGTFDGDGYSIDQITINRGGSSGNCTVRRSRICLSPMWTSPEGILLEGWQARL